MNSNKFVFGLIFFLLAGAFSLGAQEAQVGEIEGELIGVNTAQQNLRWVSVHKFEDDAFWNADMSRDFGFITLRRFEGGPMDKEPLEEEENIGIVEADDYVLGAKIEHLRRGVMTYSFRPLRPIPIPGIAKVISLWVVGRNLNHSLYIIVQDQYGNRAKIPMDDGSGGGLRHSGWKQLYGTIPDNPRRPHLIQSNFRYPTRQGIMITEILVEADPVETFGNYFIYFDDLRAQVDLFSADNRDPDDMADFW